MSSASPLISVIVPNYNHSHYLDRRMKSIINQTYQNIEIIILDDKSTDKISSNKKKNIRISYKPIMETEEKITKCNDMLKIILEKIEKDIYRIRNYEELDQMGLYLPWKQC